MFPAQDLDKEPNQEVAKKINKIMDSNILAPFCQTNILKTPLNLEELLWVQRRHAQ